MSTEKELKERVTAVMESIEDPGCELMTVAGWIVGEEEASAFVATRSFVDDPHEDGADLAEAVSESWRSIINACHREDPYMEFVASEVQDPEGLEQLTHASPYDIALCAMCVHRTESVFEIVFREVPSPERSANAWNIPRLNLWYSFVLFGDLPRSLPFLRAYAQQIVVPQQCH